VVNCNCVNCNTFGEIRFYLIKDKILVPLCVNCGFKALNWTGEKEKHEFWEVFRYQYVENYPDFAVLVNQEKMTVQVKRSFFHA